MSDDREIEFTRRKALAGIGAIGAGSAAAGMGTTAYFSDEESFENNQLTAGELDLRIDWQQLYWGMPEGHRYAPYGSAGRPFVSAHPDHDVDGEQSLNSDNFDSVPDDGVVRYSDESANLQDYLTCETLPNWGEIDFDNDNPNYSPDSLIHLTDVKPGDCGEVTFSLHLCDNPGYIWIDGETNVLDDPFGDLIRVEAWYDIDCDNELHKEDGEERIIVGHPTSLENFLDGLERGFQLNPEAYPHINGVTSGDDEGNDEPVKATAGTIKWKEGGLELADGTDGSITVTGNDPLEYTVVFDDDGNTVILRFSDLLIEGHGVAKDESDDLSKVTRFDWELLKEWNGHESDTPGMYTTEIEMRNGEVMKCFLDPCDDSGDDVWPEDEIKSTKWFYCLEDPGPCFPPEEPFCVGFSWCVPTWVGNAIQAQEVGWDLAFYTEQCRHNPMPSGPPSEG